MTTTTTETKKTINITMSDRPPVRIVEEDWPIIAEADDHDGQVRVQANTEWRIRVREHADGRRLVYGSVQAGNGGKPAGWRGAAAGYLIDCRSIDTDKRLDAESEQTVRAIRRVAGVIGRADLADECIADLPAEDLS